ncbi:MAG: hypothetical protein GY835_28245 [bacterium]|nr:hypothetical protein [bacterium]
MKFLRIVVPTLTLFMFVASCGSEAVRSAHDYVRAKEYDRARRVLELELRENPKSNEAYLLLGEINLLVGQAENGEKAFKKALLLKEKSRRRVAEIYFESAQRLLEDKFSRPLKDESSLAPRELLVLLYLEQSVHYDPALGQEVSQWALETGYSHLEKRRFDTAFQFAMTAGEAHPDQLKTAAALLRDTALQAPLPEDGSAARQVREHLEKAVQWNPDLAGDEDFVLLRVRVAPGATDLAWVKKNKPILDAKRAKFREDEARTKMPSKDIFDLSKEITQRAVNYLNETGHVVGSELNEDQRFIVDAKVDEDIFLARVDIDTAGLYDQALDIYRASLHFDPGNEKLQAGIAEAKEMRFMSEDRFAAAKNGMTTAEVDGALGPVCIDHIKTYGARPSPQGAMGPGSVDLVLIYFDERFREGVTVWFYRRDDGGAAAVFFREKDGKMRVFGTDYNAIDFSAFEK